LKINTCFLARSQEEPLKPHNKKEPPKTKSTKSEQEKEPALKTEQPTDKNPQSTKEPLQTISEPPLTKEPNSVEDNILNNEKLTDSSKNTSTTNAKKIITASRKILK
jgi:hypothetical protein